MNPLLARKHGKTDIASWLTLRELYGMLTGRKAKNLKEWRAMRKRYPPMPKDFFRKRFPMSKCKDGILTTGIYFGMDVGAGDDQSAINRIEL